MAAMTWLASSSNVAPVASPFPFFLLSPFAFLRSAPPLRFEALLFPAPHRQRFLLPSSSAGTIFPPSDWGAGRIVQYVHIDTPHLFLLGACCIQTQHCTNQPRRHHALCTGRALHAPLALQGCSKREKKNKILSPFNLLAALRETSLSVRICMYPHSPGPLCRPLAILLSFLPSILSARPDHAPVSFFVFFASAPPSISRTFLPFFPSFLLRSR